MSGLVLKDLPVAVDYWKLRYCKDVELFFLTHIHTDHTSGLTDRFPHQIYCSTITKKLLLLKYKDLADKVVELEMEQPTLLQYDKGHKTMTVTPLDARHCYGSCMFLFEGPFGRILYTGDFRFCNGMMYDYVFLKYIIEGGVVDAVYLDNTYCSRYCNSIKTREDGLNEILNLIKTHEDHAIILSLRSFGKEALLLVLAQCLKRRIWLSKARHEMLTAIEAPDVFTRDQNVTNIYVNDTFHATRSQKEQFGAGRPVLEIVPTGLNCALLTGKLFEKSDDTIVVDYSDHSTYLELHRFIKMIQPRHVYPILTGTNGRLAKEITDYTDMSVFDRYLNKEPKMSPFHDVSDVEIFTDVEPPNQRKSGGLMSPNKGRRTSAGTPGTPRKNKSPPNPVSSPTNSGSRTRSSSQSSPGKLVESPTSICAAKSGGRSRGRKPKGKSPKKKKVPKLRGVKYDSSGEE